MINLRRPDQKEWLTRKNNMNNNKIKLPICKHLSINSEQMPKEHHWFNQELRLSRRWI